MPSFFATKMGRKQNLELPKRIGTNFALTPSTYYKAVAMATTT
jgi:hypothetical protein